MLANNQERQITIVVEGNIGSGKTTLLKDLSLKIEDVEFIEEPVHLWKDLNGVNLLVSTNFTT